MIAKTLSQYIDVPEAKIVRLLNMPQSKIYEDSEYKGWVQSLNADALHDTLPQARAAYERMLGEFTGQLASRYGLEKTAMSAYTLGNWVVGFLNYPDKVNTLPKIHHRLSHQAVEEMLPAMIGMLDEMSTGRAEWQRALAVLSLPLLARE